MIVDNADAMSVWNQIVATGQPHGLKPVGLGARDTLRLEAAMPLYGHELAEDINAYEAGLGFAVQLKDREFLGREALAAQKQTTPPRTRIGLTVEGKRAPREGYPVLNSDGRQVGRITSGAYSPTLEQSIAMALVETDAADQPLSVDIRGKVIAAQLAALPFYQRPRSE